MAQDNAQAAAAATRLLRQAGPSAFTWNAKAQRYINRANGRFVSPVDVRNELDRIIDESSKRLITLSQRLVAAEISLAEWQLGMANEIKLLHTCHAVAAKGGWAQMEASDWGRVGNRIRDQYGYLQRFANQIYTGQQALNGSVVTRATMYAEAARGTYEAERRALAAQAGFTEERNILGVADHCEGCLDQTSKGWQRIGTLVPIGGRQCKARCRCHMSYRRAPSATTTTDTGDT